MNPMLLLALRMVPWKSPANELCDQMKRALIASKARSSFWDKDMDILIYVLYVVSAAGVYWDDRLWPLDLLQRSLEVKYGPLQADWPTNWEALEIFNLKRFAWSEVLLVSQFYQTCDDLNILQHSDLDEGFDLADDEESNVSP